MRRREQAPLWAALLAAFALAWAQGGAWRVESAALDPVLQERLASATRGREFGVFVHGATTDAAREAVRESGLRMFDVFERAAVVFAVGSASAIERASKHPGVSSLEGDRPIEFYLDTAHKATRGDAAQQGFTAGGSSVPGADGSGVSIAVLDSGIDGTHPMFQQDGTSKVVRNVKLVCYYLGVPCTGSPGNARDQYFRESPTNDTDSISAGGHGTHVAGIAAGADVTTLDGRVLRGAAPGARLVGVSIGHSLSIYGAAAGLNWVLEHQAAPCGEPDPECPPIRVVNNSWGTGGEFDPHDTITKLSDLLVRNGVVVVFAHGNGGGDGSENNSNPFAVNPTPGVVSAANYDDEDRGTRDGSLDSTSSRGQKGRPGTYPDVSAPGSDITSACRAQLTICRGADVDPDYGTISGTSMSAPVVAGIAAQLIQADPSLTPGGIEEILEDTAYKFAAGGRYESDPGKRGSSTSFDKGHGLVDVKAALARVRGVSLSDPAPPAQAAPFECNQGSRIAVDGRGDTWFAKVFLGSNEIEAPPHEPAMDLVGGRLAFDDAAKRLEATVELADLSALSSQPSPIAWQVTFDYDDGRYYLEAYRDPAGGERFTFGQLLDVRIHYVDVSGAIDVAADTVSISVTNAQLESVDVKALQAGDRLSGISLIARHAARTDVTTVGPARDSAESPCTFVIGTGVKAPPAPTIDASLSATTTSYAWTSGPFTRTPSLGGLVFGDACTSSDDPRCDRKRIEITVPAIGATLAVTTTSTDEKADFDLYVFGPDGEEIGSSAGGDSEEEVVVRITDGGVYTVAVSPYFASGSSYSGRASIDTSPPLSEVPAAGSYDGTIDPGGGYSWTGGGVHANPLFRCSGIITSLCDTERIWTKVPASGATLTVDVTHHGDPDYTDLLVYVFDPSGERVAQSESGGAEHRLTAFVTTPGVYSVAVTGLAAGGSYDAKAALDRGPGSASAPGRVETKAPSEKAPKKTAVRPRSEKKAPAQSAALPPPEVAGPPEPTEAVGEVAPPTRDKVHAERGGVAGRQAGRAAALALLAATGAAMAGARLGAGRPRRRSRPGS